MDKQFIKKWLKDHKYCVIATSFKDRPWAATVNYTVDDNFNIYISSRPDSLKFQNILSNPTVCLVIDSQTREGTLQIQGLAEPLKPKSQEEPNLLVKPKFLTFLKKESSGKLKRISLNLN
jgi:nitroimidazol reductase NimA-like FMN-containing flavoprotein (pyridoxamine 5'-phosphate oxidase superfamily)